MCDKGIIINSSPLTASHSPASRTKCRRSGAGGGGEEGRGKLAFEQNLGREVTKQVNSGVWDLAGRGQPEQSQEEQRESRGEG